MSTFFVCERARSLDLVELKAKIKSLNEALWENKADWPVVQEWLENFAAPGDPSERLHALHLLAQFMYFGSREMRELLRALYRDHYQYPLVERIRRENGNTADMDLIQTLYAERLNHTRFLGVGNPAESGTHLLYYFRQENLLPKTLFIHSHQIFAPRTVGGTAPALRSPDVTNYVFIDDLCGSGRQAKEYSTEIVEEIKRLRSDVFVRYFVLFGTSHGLHEVRTSCSFDEVRALYELDESFKCFHPSSRYFTPHDVGIDKGFAERICRAYGNRLLPSHPLGYRDGQLLLGFHHNVPDNTLPIIWSEDAWQPAFRRYPKVYE